VPEKWTAKLWCVKFDSKVYTVTLNDAENDADRRILRYSNLAGTEEELENPMTPEAFRQWKEQELFKEACTKVQLVTEDGHLVPLLGSSIHPSKQILGLFKKVGAAINFFFEVFCIELKSNIG